MTLIWIITDTEDGNVIIAASSQKNAEQQLFDYMGWQDPRHADTVRYLGFERMIYSEFEDDFVGTYKFESVYPPTKEWVSDTFRLFSVVLDHDQKI